MTIRVLAFLGLCCLVAACSSPRPLGPTATATGPSSGVSVVDAATLPPPGRTDLLAASRPYFIGPFDRLVIDVFGIAELQQKEYQTDSSGRLSFPLVGVVEASGKTPAELEAEIETRLRGRFIRDPQVTINLKETVSQVVTVDGQVREPGLYPVVGRMTLMRAVATAKGLDEFAKEDDVVIFRTVEGRKMAALYNLKAIRRGNYDDPEIFANDVVVVGDSPGRRLVRDIIGLAPALLSPLIITLAN